MKIVIYQTSDLHGYIYPTNYVNDQPLGFLKIASYILNDEKFDKRSKTMKIVIYQTSDLHGYIYPTNYVNDQPLGFLKIASYILNDEKNYDASLKIDCGDLVQGSALTHFLSKQYVNDQPLGFLKIASYILNDEKNYDASLKIDCGDLVQGSALTHFLSKQAIEENPIIKGLEAINYNAYVLGNHEFNYGLNYLKNAYDKISDKVINANIKGLPFNTKPYKVFDFNGFKVGCIGFTTVYIPNWEQEANIKDLEFLDVVKQYAKYEKELKENCDFIIVCYIGFTTVYIPNWEQEANIKDLEFLDVVKQYAKYEKELKENCDFIIVCYHGGFEKSLDENMTPTEALTKENQGSELLENFDSINMILSGHQHRSFITKINVHL